MDLNLMMVANGCVIALGMLVDELDKRGIIDKGEFADNLDHVAKYAEDHAKEKTKAMGLERLDLYVLRDLAEKLRDPQPPQGWTPRLIPGGKN